MAGSSSEADSEDEEEAAATKGTKETEDSVEDFEEKAPTGSSNSFFKGTTKSSPEAEDDEDEGRTWNVFIGMSGATRADAPRERQNRSKEASKGTANKRICAIINIR